jgi:transposase
MAAVKTTTVASFTRKRPSRKPFPEHLPRERVIVSGPTACLCCGGGRLRKLGEDVTETLESIPRQWKVIQHVREKFTCRDCEKISQAPAPFHVIARGWAGPSLLAMILFEKFGQHQPLNRQAERYAKEGVPLILILDQAGWHGSKDLRIPSNISLIPLPPRSPELNPQKNIWQFMRQNWLSNRVFKTFDDIVDHCCFAWNTLIDQPWKIMSIARCDWAIVGRSL